MAFLNGFATRIAAKQQESPHADDNSAVASATPATSKIYWFEAEVSDNGFLNTSVSREPAQSTNPNSSVETATQNLQVRGNDTALEKLTDVIPTTATTQQSIEIAKSQTGHTQGFQNGHDWPAVFTAFEIYFQRCGNRHGSIREFCRNHDIAERSFRFQRRKLNNLTKENKK